MMKVGEEDKGRIKALGERLTMRGDWTRDTVMENLGGFSLRTILYYVSTL